LLFYESVEHTLILEIFFGQKRITQHSLRKLFSKKEAVTEDEQTKIELQELANA
jgi:hypothetical protein